MIVVQRVVTEWTKRSRGAPGAVRRNAVPEACPVPPADGAGVLVHQVFARERDGFAGRETRSGHTLPASGSLPLDGVAGVRLERADGRLQVTGVTGVWCQCFTVFPRRPDRTVLVLLPGRWGRWRLNFRLWEDDGHGEWRYQKWVVNVAHLAGPAPAELFQASPPATVTDEMVQLARPTAWDRRALRPGAAPGTC
ncbi:hypothetical protein GCM10020358_37210 [Amorphoplanes nipponensis]|uniref:Uncharacterized protein n=1 Tax=Actinoplanes nipponensis TaxID=135950 RepID=A0A919JNJ1_9ACTN|nr:hypothetical protein [Actinoplanes nipponensis]GIE53891.1 hypothetical protein Ani05nite_74250 [Actinoplanes nipponensis]